MCDAKSGDHTISDLASYGRQEEAFKMAKTCISSAGSGVWAATGGKVEGAVHLAKGAVDFVKSPIQSMSKMADSMKQTYKAVGEIYNQGWSFFSTLPASLVTDLVCSMGASLATESLLTILTGGANSAAMAARVLKYVGNLKIIAQLKSLAQSLGVSILELFKSLETFDAKARAKLNELLATKEGRKRVESLMVSCTI